MAISTRVAGGVACLCVSWALSYVYFASTPGGHEWYGNLSKKWYDDYKGGIPVLCLAVPLLLMGSTSSLLVVAEPPERPPTSMGFRGYNYVPSSRILAVPYVARIRLRRTLSRTGFDIMSLLFILVPLVVYFLASVYRHLAGNEPTLQKKIGSTGNAAGMTAMVALSFFLVPVSRHSVLLSLAGWAEEKAVRLHIWAGRIAIVGATFHGLAHMLRWWTMGVSVVRMLLPGGACWRWNNGDVTPSFCADGSAEGECTCYELFRNFTGLVAVLALLVIGFSSLPSVRRNSYTIFYTLHVTAGPLALIVTVLHWNRMLLFLCPSIIYYLASTVPVLIQLLRSYLNEGGVKLLSATELATTGGKGGYQSLSCICLNFEVSEEAAKQFRSGQYVKVIVPEISMISHPFTVSRRLDAKQKNQMQIIFRVTGKFTGALAHCLMRSGEMNLDSAEDGNHDRLAPSIIMDGFYGQKDRLDQILSHDSMVFIAGGVGITPYLTLVSDICSAQVHQESMVGFSSYELHWICRDALLIEFVRREYFEPLLKKSYDMKGCSVRIVIHSTAPTDTSANVAVIHNGDLEGPREKIVSIWSSGLPFSPSSFKVGTTAKISGNLPIFLTFSSIAWFSLWVIWILYDNVTSKTEIVPRGYGLLVLVPITLIFGTLANIIVDKIASKDYLAKWIGLDGRGGVYEQEHSVEGASVFDSESGISLPEMASSGKRESPGPSTVNDQVDGVSGDRSMNQNHLFIELESGRPPIHSLFATCMDSRNPGISICGPHSLMNDVKAAAKVACQGSCGFDAPTVYEETFEL